jgi:hypothetical protein
LATGGRLFGASVPVLVLEDSPTRLRCMASRGCHSASVHAVSTVDKDYSKVLEVIMGVTTAVTCYSATGNGHAPPTRSPMVGVAKVPRFVCGASRSSPARRDRCQSGVACAPRCRRGRELEEVNR